MAQHASNDYRIAVSAVSVALAISAVLGVAILATDGYLWESAPSHAYGLIVFVAADVSLALAIWKMTRISLVGAALLGVVQFAAMLGDVFTGEPAGLPLSSWQQYILGDGYFVALLAMQLALVTLAVVVIRYLRPVGFARPSQFLHPSRMTDAQE